MNDAALPNWQPTTFLRFERALATSARTALIVTDAGRAYIKAMGPKLSPNTLACEWVGSQLARWFGLPTFRFALMPVDDIDEIPLADGTLATPGMAFVSQEIQGHVWSGTREELQQLENPEDISRLVVFDTWTLNCDRFAPAGMNRLPHYDNVFLSHEVMYEGVGPGYLRLIGMDHTHCFSCGRELTAQLANIDRVKSDAIYGLFPAFVSFVDQIAVRAAVATLRLASTEVVRPMVESIPDEWQVSLAARTALVQLICSRAAYLVDRISDGITALCLPDDLNSDSRGGPP
ncbi:MAG: HipA family kinase [Tepidisphaeraceae bacterium]